jgi:hypothetical protein
VYFLILWRQQSELRLFYPSVKVVLLLAIGFLPASGLIFRDGLSPAPNTRTAPTGDYAGSGWQHQLRYLTSHATIISPKHFITADHLGSSEEQVTQQAFFNGVELKTFAIKGTPVRIGDSDLQIFEIWETFDDYALLYTKSDEVGKEMVVHGRGIDRDEEVVGRGWKWGAYATQKSRWGRNEVGGSVDVEGNELLHFDFSDVLGEDEAIVSPRDSGGGWFIKDGPIWKLAAVTFSVDASYSSSAIPSNQNRFNGVFYDAGGLSLGNDDSGWDLIPTFGESEDPSDIRFYRQTNGYGSRISDRAEEIQALIDPAIEWKDLSPAEKFDNWLEGVGISPSGFADDPDHDGFSNLEEYLAGSDPSDGSTGVGPMTIDYLPDGSHSFVLVESLDLEGRHLSSVLESSIDLDNWVPAGELTEISTVRDNPAGVQTRSLTRTPAQNGSLFYRLRITMGSSN